MIEYAIHLLDKLLGDSYGEETEEIRNSLKLLKNSAFGMVKIEEIKAFVETYQKLLLENKKKQEGQNSNDKILDYLETYFFDCLNDKLPLSELGRKRQMAESRIYIEKLSNNVKTSIPEKLYKVLLPVLEPQNNPEYTVHFSRYLPHFLRRWKLDMDHLGDRLTEDDIINFMISINFNSTGFFKYLTDEILSDTQAQENPNLQEEILTSKLYRFKQVQTIIGYPFDPD
ncbi:MAG: hypothetical protein K2Q22_16825, partial [Cytophagales bacterium]|nr:hypothetical protein [Cytophagales bacterium]